MLVEFSYNRAYAVEYARKWALSRNPLFTDFSRDGGNCTNFVSQCLLAGCSVMNFTPTFGWYYRSIDDRAPAWTGVEQLYGFLTGSGDYVRSMAEGPFAAVAQNRRVVEVGDVVQLASASGDFYHTLIISDIRSNDILVCAHSDDALDRPLSSYNYSSLRILHVQGVAIDLPTEVSARELYEGLGLSTLKVRTESVLQK